MKLKKIFVQFYSYDTLPRRYLWIDNKWKIDDTKLMLLGNSFSHVYNECKERGDIVWVRYDVGGTVDEVLSKNKNIPFPDPSVDIAYVSAFFVSNLNQVYLWSLSYPNIDFIVGGPAVRFINPNSIPEVKNLRFSNLSLEEYFKFKEWNWKIDIPEENVKCSRISSAPINIQCYWNKCIFCSYNIKDEVDKSYFPSIESISNLPKFNSPLTIHFNIPCLNKNMLHNLISLSEIDNESLLFGIFLRADDFIIDEMERILPKMKNLHRFKIIVGLEFPSQRMIKVINKGITLENYIRFSKLLESYNIYTYSVCQFGWNNLIDEDVKEAEYWIDRMSNKTIISLRQLTALHKSRLYNEDYFNEERRHITVGKFYCGYVPILSKKQFDLNKAVVDLFFQKKMSRIIDTYSGGDHINPSPYWNSSAL